LGNGADKKKEAAVRPQYFPAIDLLRFAAAAMVVLLHLAYSEEPGFEFKASQPVISNGWVGVEIFFVISGFVIAHSASQSSPTHFLLDRFMHGYAPRFR
jgi:peptidoglycan/LPS O-acetylase OafA/YrhL